MANFQCQMIKGLLHKILHFAPNSREIVQKNIYKLSGNKQTDKKSETKINTMGPIQSINSHIKTKEIKGLSINPIHSLKEEVPQTILIRPKNRRIICKST